jgi:2-hydroxy-6-oxonona-2,4-dienedioate hydrolase
MRTQEHIEETRKKSMSQQKGKLEDKRVLVEGQSYFYRTSTNPVPAQAPVIVLVHGLVVSGRYLLPTAQRLAPFYRVYVPDLPGFGNTVKPHHVLNLDELSDALHAWMQAIGLKQAVLLGNSLGCQTIAHFAVRHPEAIQQAILVGPTTDPQGRAFQQQFPRWLLAMPREPLSLFPILLLDYFQAGIRRTIRTMQYMLQDRMEDLLPHIQVPTLVVRGSRDTIVPQRWAEQAARLLPQGRLVVIEGPAHTVNYSAPTELLRITRAFLESSDSISRPSPKRTLRVGEAKPQGSPVGERETERNT